MGGKAGVAPGLDSPRKRAAAAHRHPGTTAGRVTQSTHSLRLLVIGREVQDGLACQLGRGRIEVAAWAAARGPQRWSRSRSAGAAAAAGTHLMPWFRSHVPTTSCGLPPGCGAGSARQAAKRC